MHKASKKGGKRRKQSRPVLQRNRHRRMKMRRKRRLIKEQRLKDFARRTLSSATLSDRIRITSHEVLMKLSWNLEEYFSTERTLCRPDLIHRIMKPSWSKHGLKEVYRMCRGGDCGRKSLGCRGSLGPWHFVCTMLEGLVPTVLPVRFIAAS